jgi:hypothetical protein
VRVKNHSVWLSEVVANDADVAEVVRTRAGHAIFAIFAIQPRLSVPPVGYAD